MFSLAYCGLFHIREPTKSPHVIKVYNVNIGIHKNKMLFVLDSSKTHDKESKPQKVKISEIFHSKEGKKWLFCPFDLSFMVEHQYLHTDPNRHLKEC